MNNSRHHRWQTRWLVDHSTDTYTHETGLVVKFYGRQDITGRADNAAEVQAQLAVKNGHNAAAMVARMMREAAQLHAKGAAARLNKSTPAPRTSN